MMNFAKQAFQKHKEIEIAYALKLKNNNEDVSEEKYTEALQKYKDSVRLGIDAVNLETGPTGTTQSASNNS